MNTLLLDTQIVLWWLADDPRLTDRLREEIGRGGEVYVSSASTWEVAIKLGIGKLRLRLEDGETFPSMCAAQGFRLLPIDHDDAWAVGALPESRTDPFDRLIAAVASRRRWTVVTADHAFAAFGVSTLMP